MVYQLRGHHLLCLLGYRGMGYSQAYVENMTRLHQTLRAHPETDIELVEGPDSLCAHFPLDSPYHCQDANVHERDANILHQLGLAPGEVHAWRELESKLADGMVPSDIVRLCYTCQWRSYGVCEQGVERLRNGDGLTPVE